MIRSMYASRNLVSTMEKMHSQGEAETFSPFHDYFGLSNLIISDGTLASLDSPSSESSSNFEYPSSPIYKRHRKNSLDLDSVSDSSSSISSRDSEILFESVTVSGDSSTGFPSSSIDVTLAPSYAKTLESIIAHQNTIGRFSNAAVSKESKNSKTSHKANVCVFCRNNGESREFYSSHTLKDNNGSTTCPILRAYTCPLCKANGDGSHTIKYCPKYTPKLKTESNFLGLTLI